MIIIQHITNNDSTSVLRLDTKRSSIVQVIGTLVNSGGGGGSSSDTPNIITEIAGEDLGGYKVVIANNTGIITANSSSINHANKVIGVTLQSSSAGSSINIINNGKIENSNWNWASGSRIYFNNTGTLTNTVPTSGFIQQIGIAMTHTSILINIQPAIAY